MLDYHSLLDFITLFESQNARKPTVVLRPHMQRKMKACSPNSILTQRKSKCRLDW